MRESLVKVPFERIEKTIYLIWGQRVMLDRDLAALYGVFRIVFDAIRDLMKPPEPKRKEIGFQPTRRKHG
jgi:hypothetical protein